jgi:hypothetical protein
MPYRVELTENGRPLPDPVKSKFADITLSIDTSFPADYRQLLQDTFDTAKSTINAVYGQPVLGGTVLVSNYDSSIGDRQAVAGGYYTPNNGLGQREIRFPIYLSREAAAVNFLHCILLAYQGTTPYAFDVFQEGIARAAAARIARTSGVFPTFDPERVEQVLFNTYEVGGWYDWHNQRALGGRNFIASNLIRDPLPVGGTYGGLYLLRYRMAGSVWSKVLVEYPSFAAELNASLAADPTIAGDRDKLISASQAILNKLRPTSPTIEGLSFSDWAKRQYILETDDTNGTKALAQVTPILSGLSEPDFGVFNIELHYFRRDNSGSESLLSGVCYPVFWDTEFNNRISPSAQDDRMDIAGAYGSVGPNLPDSLGQPYRANVDLPVADVAPRLFLPAGSIATAAQPKANNFYGTISGIALTPPSTYTVRLRLDPASPIISEAPVTHYAFGATVASDDFVRARSLVVELVSNGTAILFQRRVNKGPGELALDLRVNEFTTFNLPDGIRRGLQGLGFPIEPLRSAAPELLGIPSTNLLLARYNSNAARYDLFPDSGAIQSAHGYLLRAENTSGLSIIGRRVLGHPTWALKPGWNMVTLPVTGSFSISSARVLSNTSFPVIWSSAVGTIVGNTVFEFSPGGNDPSTGAPESGGFRSVTGLLEPGKMYFVRCLSSTGALVVFDPNLASTSSSRRSQVGIGANVWSMRVSVRSAVEFGEVMIATSRTATDKFDAKEDSPPAPKVGAFEVKLTGPAELYRDTRRTGNPHVYTMRFDGLVAGKTYSVQFTPEQGYTNWVTLYDPTARKTFRPYRGGTYTFKAKKSSQTMTISVVGA